ncbi:MAG TPA: hypothetical protein VE993_19380, partial [Stellaceae bacterium]|nr:hypothetical protein [Stellaceae bacterium]
MAAPPPMTATLCRAIERLPASGAALFENGQDFCLGMAWFRNMVANGLPSGSQAFFEVLMRGGEAVAVLPLQQGATGELHSLTNCYTCLYRPLIATEGAGDIAHRLGRAAGSLFSRQPLVRIECLPADWPALDAFVDGLGTAGLAIRRFDHFGNWHEPIRGRGWEDYLAARPGHLRELLRRRGRHKRHGDLRFEI